MIGCGTGSIYMRFRYLIAGSLLVSLIACSAIHENREWYLIRPPLKSGQSRDALAPVSSWERVQSYDSRVDCEDHLLMPPGTKMIASNGIFQQPRVRSPEIVIALDSSVLYKCIAADDPRFSQR
jgi:hypothetical protein